MPSSDETTWLRIQLCLAENGDKLSWFFVFQQIPGQSSPLWLDDHLLTFMPLLAVSHGFKGTGPRFHSRPWTANGMRIYKKSVNLVRSNKKFETKMAFMGKMSNLNENFGSLMPSLSLTLNVEP
jgi:hypothetical protein